MERDEIMGQAEAARAYIDRVPHNKEKAEDLEFEAFMSIFHPKVYANQKRMGKLRDARRHATTQ